MYRYYAEHTSAACSTGRTHLLGLSLPYQTVFELQQARRNSTVRDSPLVLPQLYSRLGEQSANLRFLYFVRIAKTGPVRKRLRQACPMTSLLFGVPDLKYLESGRCSDRTARVRGGGNRIRGGSSFCLVSAVNGNTLFFHMIQR